jgi:PDZ domain-containing protein
MRALALLAVLLASRAAAAQPAPADPLPLRPGGPGIEVQGVPHLVDHRRPGSPADRADVPHRATVVAVDGRNTAGWSTERVRTALAGPVGSPVAVTVEHDGRTTTFRLRREDRLGPEPGYTGVVVTPRFVAHHHPGPGPARLARTAAERAERGYARSGLPHDTRGRRAHLWVIGARKDVFSSVEDVLPMWAAWVGGERDRRGEETRTFGYLAYGLPGPAAVRLAPFDIHDTRSRRAHLYAATALRVPRWHAERRDTAWQFANQSELWRAELPFDQAMPRVLGLSPERLTREWREYVLDPGPDPEVPLRAGEVAVVLGWGALGLLWGVRAARRKEVGVTGAAGAVHFDGVSTSAARNDRDTRYNEHTMRRK